MDANFWHQKWEDNDIRFHESQANPALVNHINQLNLKGGARVFLPLCGKTLDISWLLGQGYRIVGAELSELAINDLFAELGLTPDISQVGSLIHYRAHHIDLWVGDIFELSGNMLGAVDAIYDRGALVAMPTQMRKRYAAHLIEISHNAPQLLIAYEYEQDLYQGPPFSLTEKTLENYYQRTYRLELLERSEVVDGFSGQIETYMTTWRLGGDR